MRGRPLCLFVLAALVLGCGGGGQPAPRAPRDSSSPRITEITGITDDAVVSGSVQLAATATDNVGIASFTLRIDDTLVVAAVLSSIVYTWDTRRMLEGEHKLCFSASDAAGNVDTSILHVSVHNGVTPLPEQPEEPEGPPEELPVQEARDWNATDFLLPPIGPENLDPEDSQQPQLLLSGIADGGTVWGICHISVTALDDTNVNLIGFLVNGALLLIREQGWLSVDWDTRLWPDGPVEVGFILRDGSAQLYQAKLNVHIDNTTEHDPPVIELLGFDQRWICGTHRLVFRATDESGVAWIRAEVAPPTNQATPLEDRFVIESSNSELVFDWDTTTVKDNIYYFDVFAADTLGHIARAPRVSLVTVNGHDVRGRLRAPNGNSVSGALVCVLPSSYSGSYDTLPNADCVAHTTTSHSGTFDFDEIPLGVWRFVAICDGRVIKFKQELMLVHDSQHRIELTTEQTTYLRAFGSPELDLDSRWERPLLVTGTDEDIREAVGKLEDQPWPWSIAPADWYVQDGGGVTPTDDGDDFDWLLQFEHAEGYLFTQSDRLLLGSGGAFEEAILTDPDLAAALRGWVMDGGILAVIGRSYDYVEQLWPEKIDFVGTDTVDGLCGTPEELNAAEVGPAWLMPGDSAQSAGVPCMLHNVQLHWHSLSYGPSLEHGLSYSFGISKICELAGYDIETDTLPIDVYGFRADWPVIERVAEDVTIWVTLSEPPSGAVPPGTPVMVSFQAGLGKVFYTSYLFGDTTSDRPAQVPVLLLPWF